MKKIVSIFVLLAMMLASVLAVIPVAAEESPVYAVEDSLAIPVEWEKLTFRSLYDGAESKKKFDEEYDVTIDGATFITRANSTTSSEKSDNLGYAAQTEYPITADTYYVYEFRAKLNRDTGYAGVVFAINGNDHYFAGGAFASDGDHDNADGTRASHIVLYNGSWSGNLNSTFGDHHPVPTLADSEGYGSWRIIYDGLDIYVQYIAKDGNWAYIASSSGSNAHITLPEGSFVAFGAHNRGGSPSSERTITINNATLYNCKIPTQDAAKPADKTELNEYIAYVEATFASTLYTASSYSALQTALAAAKEAVADETLTQGVADIKLTALMSAVKGLKADTSALNALIQESRKLLKANYTADTWTAFEAALDEAENNANSTDVATIKTVYDALVVAKNALVTVELNKAALEEMLELAALLVKDEFNAYDWAKYAEKLTAAQDAFENATIQSDIDAAASALENAIKTLNGGVLPDKPVEKPTEEPTEQPTEQPTEKPTEKPTEQATATEPTTNEGGCGGIIGASAVVVAVVLGAVVLKKKED